MKSSQTSGKHKSDHLWFPSTNSINIFLVSLPLHMNGGIKGEICTLNSIRGDRNQAHAFIWGDKARERAPVCVMGGDGWLAFSLGATVFGRSSCVSSSHPSGLNYTRHSGSKWTGRLHRGTAVQKYAFPLSFCPSLRRSNEARERRLLARRIVLWLRAPRWDEKQSAFDWWTSALHLIRNLSLSGCDELRFPPKVRLSPELMQLNCWSLVMQLDPCAHSFVFSAAWLRFRWLTL